MRAGWCWRDAPCHASRLTGARVKRGRNRIHEYLTHRLAASTAARICLTQSGSTRRYVLLFWAGPWT
jgi:hypothetical protein